MYTPDSRLTRRKEVTVPTVMTHRNTRLTRRRALGLAATASAVATLPAASRPALAAVFASPLPPLPDRPSNVLIRMQAELQRALTKPIEQRSWAMGIDLSKCIGCSACTIACVSENKLPPGVVYRPVIEETAGTYPHVARRFTPRPCMQCDEPPCVPVCPVSGATYKRPDGIVAIDYDACIGCRYCVTACPYGARTADFGGAYTEGTPAAQPYEAAKAHEYSKTWVRAEGASPIGTVRKCHFCIHRIEAGMLPACVTTCIGVATFFGDMNDPESLIHELAGRPNVSRLKEELGTKPKVFYLT